jgi:rhamnose transport system permease protein
MGIKFRQYKREISALGAYVALLLIVAFFAPGFFSAANLRDLLVNNAAVLIVAVGMTLVILTGEVDISVGSQFAVCSVAAGALAKTGLPLFFVLIAVLAIGAFMGAVNGMFISRLRMPSIVVTLAMLVVWRDGLRWITEGAWVQNLPANFQWLGLSQPLGELMIVGCAFIVLITCGWILQNIWAGRAIYAVGSDAEAARLTGIEPKFIISVVFIVMGALTALAAMINAIRFSSIASNTGAGLELKAIAAVVVGGTAITGGRGNIIGTLIGVALLGTIGTALTFIGINPFWEKGIQGAIILIALASDAMLGRLDKHGKLSPRSATSG